MVWSGQHRGFAVRAYFENNQSVIATQRAFRRRFNIPRNDAVPQANTIRSWVRQLEATGSTLRRDTHGRRRSIRTPENVERVRAAVMHSPKRSARRHAVALEISSRSLRRILHMDLQIMSTSRVVVVTGANKGIGFATVKALCEAVGDQSIIYLTARSVERGTKAVEELSKKGLKPRFHPLDVEDASSIESFASFLKKEHGGLDVLINNAGIAYKNDATEPFGEQAKTTIEVNYFSLQAVCQAFFPILRSHARVVNVSSSLGHLSRVPGAQLRQQLADPALTESQLDQIMRDFLKAAGENKHGDLGWQNSAYGASKVAVSALTRVQQRQIDEDKSREDIVINHCHPGYVDIDMTSHKGILTPEQGAVCPTYLALLPPNTTAARGDYFWLDKQKVDWVNGPLPAPGY